MGLFIIGVSHKSALVDVREKLAFQRADITAIIKDVISNDIAQEVVLLFTCNRTELYFYTASPSQTILWFKDYFASGIKQLESCYYTFFDQMAIKHIMRVASGIDSMVLGETEILGQLKFAYKFAQDAGGVGKWLARLFQRTFAVAKQVRTETKIGANSLSVAYIAVRLAELIFTDICSARVMVIGAGDTAKLVIRRLIKVGIKEIWLVNRSQHNARQLAYAIDPSFCWIFLDLEKLPDHLALADIVLSSTASQLPIIGKQMVEHALDLRKHKPMLMIDIAVPRDIEVEVKNLEQVHLYCIDDLQTIADDNRQLRHKEIAAAEMIIAKQTQEFIQWAESQNSVTAIKGLRSRTHKIMAACLTKSLKLLKQGMAPEAVLSSLAYNMTNKFLHLPTVSLKQAGWADDEDLLRKLNQLFALDEVEKIYENINP